MIHVEVRDLYNRKNSILWCILSFKAGLLNAAGFLIAGTYVSHVTGFGTQVGVAIGHSEYDLTFELFIIPFAFIGGGYLTSLILDRDYTKHRIPNYPIAQGLITTLLGVIALFFTLGIFTSTTPEARNSKSLVLIGLLCLICGLKNGLTTWATHGRIRTTHLTGLSTDIGLHLQKLLPISGIKTRFPEPANVNQVRILTLLSFSLGSCISALLIPAIGYRVFYLIFAISAVLLGVSVAHRRKLLRK